MSTDESNKNAPHLDPCCTIAIVLQAKVGGQTTGGNMHRPVRKAAYHGACMRNGDKQAGGQGAVDVVHIWDHQHLCLLLPLPQGVEMHHRVKGGNTNVRPLSACHIITPLQPLLTAFWFWHHGKAHACRVRLHLLGSHKQQETMPLAMSNEDACHSRRCLLGISVSNTKSKEGDGRKH